MDALIGSMLIRGFYEGIRWVAGEILKGTWSATRGVVLEDPVKKLLKAISQGQHEGSVKTALAQAEGLLLKEYEDDPSAKLVLDALRRGQAQGPMDEFGRTAAMMYWSPAQPDIDIRQLSRIYVQAVGMPSVLRGDAPIPEVAAKVLDRFFAIFREVLLQQPGLGELRQYEQLVQDRERNSILRQILAQLTPVPPDLSAIYDSYVSFIQQEYAFLDFRGILNLGDLIMLPLEEVYIPLLVSPEPEQSHKAISRLGTMPTQALEPDPLGTSKKTASLREVIAAFPRLVLLGHPGAGKTTTIKHIILNIIHGNAEAKLGLKGDWIPIPFPIAAYAEALRHDNDLSLIEYLPRYFESRTIPGVKPLFDWGINNGRCYICIDGLDEVLEQGERQYVVSRLEDFVRAFGENRFLITSRIAGYWNMPLAESFHHALILPFRRREIEQFVEQWSTSLQRTLHRVGEHAELEARNRAIDLSRAIFFSESLTDLASNPLLLTILSLIHYQGRRLPERRVDLYRLCIEALAEHWSNVRSLSGHPIDLYLGSERLDERFVIRMLGPIALWLHESQPGGMISVTDLEERLSIQFKDDGIAPRHAAVLAGDFLRLVREGTGLLQEREPGTYRFMHFTFEEYLAARAILDLVPEPLSYVRKYCIDPSWREVIRLAISSAKPREAATLLREGILDAQGSEDDLAQTTILAGECLAALGKLGIQGADFRTFLSIMLSRMRNSAIPVRFRVTIGNLIAQLGDPRFENPYGEPEMVAVPAGDFYMGSSEEDVGKLIANTGVYIQHEMPQRIVKVQTFSISKYPITNTQYEYFVESAEYQPPKFWMGRRCPRRTANHPVTGVSWFDATAYCRWLGHVTGREYGLPTEAEWEKASRGTDARWYPWGNRFERGKANVWESGTEGTCPVGIFPDGASPYMIEDLIGNVWEWCSSLYRSYPYDPDDGREDPETVRTRILRGSGWDSNEFIARCASRIHRDQTYFDEYTGFRVVHRG